MYFWAIVLGMIPWGMGNELAIRPNVLIIITDDQGYGDFSIHGNPYLKTPNIDALGRGGVRFDRYFVNSFCAPTRAALLTGRWPLRTGCHGVTHNREAMRPSELTIAEVFAAAGYTTTCIGKWHNGEQFPFTPTGQGFHESFGFNNGHWNNYFDATLLRNSQPEQTAGYISNVLTDEAIRFIEANRQNPFLCYLSFNAPHSPYQVPDDDFAKFKSLGLDDKLAAFYGMCANIDDNVGRLLKSLERFQLTENTIVVFMTDNGGTAGVKTYNAGMRGGKTSVHEGGSRVPLFVHWPQARWTPHVVGNITSHIDVMPTLLDLCGLKNPDSLDGVSLRPLLESVEVPTWPNRMLFTHNPIDEVNRYPGAVRTQRYRLVREIRGPAGGSRAQANDSSASAWQLYDMKYDPGQKTNISAEHPAIVTELSRAYEAWFDDISSAGLQRFALPVGYAEHNPVELHAPQAYFDSPLAFASGPGYANDWLTQWETTNAKVWFDVEVMRPGTYELEVAYGTDSAAVSEAALKITVGDQSIYAKLPSALAPEIPLPHRDTDGPARYRNRQWVNEIVGKVELVPGKYLFTIEPLSKTRPQVMDFKHLKLRRL